MDEQAAAEPVATLEAKGGTLSVHGEYVEIDRSSRSMFDDKRIPLSEVRGVRYSGGIVTGHLQIEQTGVEADDAGFLSHPVDENTLHFPRGRRGDAERVRNAILERSGGD